MKFFPHIVGELEYKLFQRWTGQNNKDPFFRLFFLSIEWRFSHIFCSLFPRYIIITLTLYLNCSLFFLRSYSQHLLDYYDCYMMFSFLLLFMVILLSSHIFVVFYSMSLLPTFTVINIVQTDSDFVRIFLWLFIYFQLAFSNWKTFSTKHSPNWQYVIENITQQFSMKGYWRYGK